jgi:hypothetical protein
LHYFGTHLGISRLSTPGGERDYSSEGGDAPPLAL